MWLFCFFCSFPYFLYLAFNFLERIVYIHNCLTSHFIPLHCKLASGTTNCLILLLSSSSRNPSVTLESLACLPSRDLALFIILFSSGFYSCISDFVWLFICHSPILLRFSKCSLNKYLLNQWINDCDFLCPRESKKHSENKPFLLFSLNNKNVIIRICW